MKELDKVYNINKNRLFKNRFNFTKDDFFIKNLFLYTLQYIKGVDIKLSAPNKISNELDNLLYGFTRVKSTNKHSSQ